MKSPLIRQALLAVMLLNMTSSLSADESRFVLSGNRPTQQQTLADTVSDSGKPISPLSRQHPLRTVASSLAIVLGGFLLLTVLLRKTDSDKSSASEFMKTIGSVQVTPKVKLHLVQVGSRLLVLHLGTNSVERVAEISDPAEVQRVLHGDLTTISPGQESNSHPEVGDLLRSVDQTGAIA